MMEREKYIELLKQQGYSDRNASLVADELMKLSPELVPCLDLWISSVKSAECGNLGCGEWFFSKDLDYESNGYTIMGLVQKRQMNYPAALLTMDWIIKEPEKAIQSLSKNK